jgi:hypothetical protein
MCTINRKRSAQFWASPKYNGGIPARVLSPRTGRGVHRTPLSRFFASASRKDAGELRGVADDGRHGAARKSPLLTAVRSKGAPYGIPRIGLASIRVVP